MSTKPPSVQLRPVADLSPSPTSSTSSAERRSSRDTFASARSPSAGHLRRPLSPSSLRDVDLSHDERGPPRMYPAPPTGHELMAMFPPPAPATDTRPTSISGVFRRQERAFFAQGGREIVRVQLEADTMREMKMEHDLGIDRKPMRREQQMPRSSWPHSQHHSPAQPPMLHHRSSSRPPSQSQSHRPSPTSPMHVLPNSKTSMQQHPTPSAGSPPHDSMPPPVAKHEAIGDDYRMDDPDEAWRRPMPFAERRRAGKHTRRVIVRT